MFLEQARWLGQWHWQRADAFERKSSQLLTFEGVLLALLPVLIGPLNEVHGRGRHQLGVALLVLTASATFAAAIAALLALNRRSIPGIDIEDYRTDWQVHLEVETLEPSEALERSVALYLPRSRPSHLSALAQDAGRRGACMAWSLALVTLALTALALAVVTILTGTQP